MSPQLILTLLIIVLIANFLFSQVLEFLNLRYQPEVLPKEVEDIYSQDEYKKAKDYHVVTTKFGIWQSGFSIALWLIILLTGFLGVVDTWVSGWLGIAWLRPLAVFAVLFLLLDVLGIPFALYRNFVIEQRFGFNKMTPATFVTDKLKGYVLTIIIGGVLLGLLFWLINSIGSIFWLVFWVIATVFIVFLNMFYSSLIVPLFNKLSPLPEGELKDGLESYAKQEGFALADTFVMDGSKRSSKANAFFSGLGKQKKVVLFDTLIEKLSPTEILAVVAHEVGHYKKGHIPKMLILSIVPIGIILFLLSLFVYSEPLSLALGANGLATHLNVIAFFLFFSPLNLVISLVTNTFSRKHEFEADAFASETSSKNGMAGALKSLSTANLGNLTPHPLYVRIHYTHPTVLERIRALNTL